MVKSLLIAGFGGFVGTALRFLVTRYIQISYSSVFPWGTFIVNISGSFLIGIFLGISEKGNFMCTESIVFKAKEAGVAGATVLKGMLGYGASSVIHSYKFWEVTEKVPTVIEVIDEEEKIMSFHETISPILESMRYGCLVTTQEVNVLLYKSGQKKLFDQ